MSTRSIVSEMAMPRAGGVELTFRGSFRSGIRPLGPSVGLKSAIKGTSEDLPPINEIQAMFAHLVSRVRGR